MTHTARKLLCGAVTAAAIALTGTLPASAAPESATPAWHAQTDDGNVHDNAKDDNDDNGLWGLLGLVGLLGLAGLVRRGPKQGAMAGYPAAGAEPPANAYPPADPRRNPPGA